MKKISLKNLNLNEVEELSRSQLKEVLGGYIGRNGSIEEAMTTNYDCNCPGTRECHVSLNNNPTPEQIKRACQECCNG